MAGIKIDFLADVAQFIAGTDNVAKALDEVSDALDDLTKEADDAGKKIGDELTDGADKAADAGKDLNKDFSKALDTVKDDAKDAGKKLGNELEDGAEKAADAGEKSGKTFGQVFDKVQADAKTTGSRVGSEIDSGFKKGESAAEEFKSEAQSTSREAAASFTGDFEDVADAIQETLANALAGFGPAGAIAGMAAAAGIGILVATLQDSAEKAAEVKEGIIDLAGQIREAGGDINAIDWGSRFEDFANQIADAKEWYEPWQQASKTNLEVISADAEQLGLNFQDLFQGLGGDTKAAARAIEDVNARIIEQRDAYEQLINQGYDPAVAAQETYVDELIAQKGALEDASAATEEAVELFDVYNEALLGSVTAVEAFNEAQEERIDLMKDEADSVMDAAEAEADWAEKVATSAATLAEMNELIDTTSEATRNATDAVTDGGAAWDLYTEAGRFANEATIDLAQSAWDAITAAREQGASTDELRAKTQTARDEFVQQAIQLGLTKEAAEALATQYGLIPGTVPTTATFDAANATQSALAYKALLDSLGSLSYTIASGTYDVTPMNSGGQVKRAASGTFITGQGSDIEDRVPILASPGEMILDKQTVDQLGVGNLQQLNEGQNPAARKSAQSAQQLTADDIAVAVANALSGMQIQLTGGSALADSMAARISMARRRL